MFETIEEVGEDALIIAFINGEAKRFRYWSDWYGASKLRRRIFSASLEQAQTQAAKWEKYLETFRNGSPTERIEVVDRVIDRFDPSPFKRFWMNTFAHITLNPSPLLHLAWNVHLYNIDGVKAYRASYAASH